MNKEKQEESTNKKRDEIKLEELTKKIVNDINKDKGIIRQKWENFRNHFLSHPITEINHAWKIVNSFAERTAKYKDLNDCQIQTLATVRAYLILAKSERDFSRAWTYVNMADALLPLVVKDDEFKTCLVRLQATDEWMQKNLKKIIQNIDPTHREDRLQSPEDKKTSDSSEKNVSKKRRYLAHQGQLIRGMLWNTANCKISLKISLWHSLAIRLFLGLVLAIIVAEFAYGASNVEKTIVPLPFVSISILGFFGGGLSSIMIARKSVINITSNKSIRAHTLLRMLVGAAGSLVVYTVTQVPGLLAENISKLPRDNIYFFIALGIAAGFSEQLFVSSLDNISKNLTSGGEISLKPSKPRMNNIDNSNEKK